MSALRTAHATVPLPVRLAAALAVALIVVLGVWVAGGVITNDFAVAMGLTAAWMALAFALCVIVAGRVRALRVPVLGAYILVAVALAPSSAPPCSSTTSSTSASWRPWLRGQHGRRQRAVHAARARRARPGSRHPDRRGRATC